MSVRNLPEWANWFAVNYPAESIGTFDSNNTNFGWSLKGAEGDDSDDGDTPEPDSADKPDDEPEGRKSYSEKYVKGLKNEAQSLRQERKALQAQLDEFEKAKKDAELAELSEVERMTAEMSTQTAKIEQLEALLRQSSLERVVAMEAAKIGFNDPADALSLLDNESVSWDEDEPNTGSIRKALTKLSEDKPYLVASGEGSGDGGPKNPPTPVDAQAQRTKEYQEKYMRDGYVVRAT